VGVILIVFKEWYKRSAIYKWYFYYLDSINSYNSNNNNCNWFIKWKEIFDAKERSNLERISVEVLDNLIKTLKSPNDLDYRDNPNAENPVSFNKLLNLKKSYTKLVDENIFQDEIKSSISIYPLNCEISPIKFGNKLDNSIS
jgi:hypothetical protein